MESASFLQRALGRIFDMILLFFMLMVAMSAYVDEQDDQVVVDAPSWFLALVALVVVAYEVVPVRKRGQTPGKVVMRTRVVRFEDEQLPTWRNALTRWLLVLAVFVVVGSFSTPVALAAVTGMYASAVLDPLGRSLLDRAAGTKVVRVTRTTPDDPESQAPELPEEPPGP